MSASNRVTTVDLVKAFMTVPSTVTPATLQLHIDRSCQALADYCNRTFGSTTYKTWLDGTDENTLWLPEWPVTKLNGVGIDLVTVMEIAQTGFDFASISFDGTNVTLWSIASGVEATNTLSATTYPNMTTMAAAISAVSGWAAIVPSGMGTRAMAMMRRVESVPVGDDETVPLEGVDDLLRVRINIENGRELVIPGGYQSSTYFPLGQNNVFVWYVAGYTLPVGVNLGTTPEPLVYAANMVCKAFIEGTQDTFSTLLSEDTGDYSYSKGGGSNVEAYAITANMIESLGVDLTPYRRFM